MLVAGCFSMNAQNALPNKYIINVPSYTNGIPMPAGFVVEFREFYTYNIDTAGWTMEVGVVTYTDTTYTYTVPNDSIPNRLIFNAEKAYADSTLKENINPLKAYLLKNMVPEIIPKHPNYL